MKKKMECLLFWGVSARLRETKDLRTLGTKLCGAEPVWFKEGLKSLGPESQHQGCLHPMSQASPLPLPAPWFWKHWRILLFLLRDPNWSGLCRCSPKNPRIAWSVLGLGTWQTCHGLWRLMLIFETGPRPQGWAEAEVGFQETEQRGGRKKNFFKNAGTHQKVDFLLWWK